MAQRVTSSTSFTKAPATHTPPSKKVARAVKKALHRPDLETQIEQLQKEGWKILKAGKDSRKAQKQFESALEKTREFGSEKFNADLYHGLAHSLCTTNLSKACIALMSGINSNPSRKLDKKLHLSLIRFQNKNGLFQDALSKVEELFKYSPYVIDTAFRSKLIHEEVKAHCGLDRPLDGIDHKYNDLKLSLQITKPIEAYRYLKNHYIVLKSPDNPKKQPIYLNRCLTIYKEALTFGLSKADKQEIEKMSSEL